MFGAWNWILVWLFVCPPAWSASCLTAFSGTHPREMLWNTHSLNGAFERGKELFLDESGNFLDFVGKREELQSGSGSVYEVRDKEGRIFIFKKQEGGLHLEGEFRKAWALDWFEGLALESHIVRIGEETYFGSREFKGINVKELLGWDKLSTQTAIETMLRKKFRSKQKAIAAMKKVLRRHSKYKEFLSRAKRVFAALGMRPDDFQFMFSYDHKTKRMDIRLLDFGVYLLSTPDGEFHDVFQGVAFIEERI